MGKMLKRLENHLSRCHQGVTRAMNDQQPHFASQSRSRVTCMLPGCGKEVLHLSKHLKNIHAMSATDYLAKVEEERESQGKRKSPSKYHTNIDKTNETHKIKNDESVHDKETTGMGFEPVPESDLSKTSTVQDSPDVFRTEDKDPETTGMVFEAVPESDSSVLDFTEQERPDVLRTEDKDAVNFEPSKLVLEELNPDTYSEEKLRYLVHNTSPDGVRFLLVYVKRKGGLADFHRSKLCTDILGNMPFSTVKEIYLYRKYLTSFFRLARFYPYPYKEMINSCLACDVMGKGQCSCPVLPKSFYIFCRQKCSSDLNYKKCIYFDHRTSHCFDFFHCKRCDEDYKASTRHQPYPQINNGANQTTHFII